MANPRRGVGIILAAASLLSAGMVVALRSGPVAHAALSIPYAETWESGTSDGWTNLCINPFELCPGGAAAVTNDPAGQRGKVQVIQRETQGGDQFSPELTAQPGHTYCVSAWVNWVSGGEPYVGVSYNGASTSSGWNVAWLMGAASGGATTIIPTSATGWTSYQATFNAPGSATLLHLVDEAGNGSDRKTGSPVTYLDDLIITDCTAPTSTSVPPPPTATSVPTATSAPAATPTRAATPTATATTAGATAHILGIRMEKIGAGADLTKPSLRVVKAGKSVALAMYVQVDAGAAGAPLSFKFLAAQSGTQLVSTSVQGSVPASLPADLRETVKVKPNKRGIYTFTGTLTAGGQSEDQSMTFTVADSIKKQCITIGGKRYCS